MRIAVVAVSVTALMFIAPSAPAAPKPKAGATCSQVGVTKSYQESKFTCIKSGKKTIWSKAKNVAPRPSPTASAPATSNTPKSQPSLSISARWAKLDDSALKVFNVWTSKELPLDHAIKIDYVISQKASPEVVTEMKKRYDLAARFWAPYGTVTNPFKVLIANHNEAEWICENTYDWLYQIQSLSECVQNESNGRPNIPTAGQRQYRDHNVDSYQVANRAELDSQFFIGRVEHEFTHNIFYQISENYQKNMPCWQIEGGPELFGILISKRLDPDGFIQARNIKFETDFLNIGELKWDLDRWIKFLKEIDRSDIPNRDGDVCGPVRSKIYAHSILANEYLVSKVGIPGYLNLIKETANSSWAETVQKTFGISKDSLYQEIAGYMMAQYRLARGNRWSYEALYALPSGR